MRTLGSHRCHRQTSVEGDDGEKLKPRDIADVSRWSRKRERVNGNDDGDDGDDGDDVAWNIFFDGMPWFVIRTSTIEGAGRGLFAARDSDQDDVLGLYTGNRTTIREIDEEGIDDSYVLAYDATIGETETTICIDANPEVCGSAYEHAGWVHMANDAKDATKTNVYYTSRGFVRARTPIKSGDELFANYGLGYWCHEAVSCVEALWLRVLDAQGVSECEFEDEERVVK